jgi:hypothetical protein
VKGPEETRQLLGRCREEKAVSNQQINFITDFAALLLNEIQSVEDIRLLPEGATALSY